MRDLIFFYACGWLLFAQRNATPPRKTNASLDMYAVTMIIIGTAVLAVLGVIAYYVISNLRKNIKESEQPPSMSDHLATFQEARADGNMTAQEYDRVKAHLSKKILREVRQSNTQNKPGDEPDNDSPIFYLNDDPR